MVVQGEVTYPMRTTSESLVLMQVAQMQHGLAVVADLTGGDSEMQRAVQEVEAAFGGLDILVNR